MREYVLWRDGHKCRNCRGKSGDKILNVHHLESGKTGGNAPNNLIVLCETCHKGLHRGEIALDIKRLRSFKPETFMGILRKALRERLRELRIKVDETYGYITKNLRIIHGVIKSHANDAFCIAGNLNARMMDEVLYLKQVRKRGRQVSKANLHKGGKWLAKKTDYMIRGFSRYDKVSYDGIKCFIFGLRKTGNFLISCPLKMAQLFELT